MQLIPRLEQILFDMLTRTIIVHGWTLLNKIGLALLNYYMIFSVLMKIWERDDRFIGSLKINIFEENMYNFLIKENINFVRGQIYRIYKDQFVVIRGHVSAPEANRSKHKHLIENVQRGSLVAAIINEQPAILLTLTTFKRLANCKLLGLIEFASGKTMDLINYYGTPNGRLLEPLRFRMKINHSIE